MSLDFYGHVSDVFNTQPAGGVLKLTAEQGHYDYDNGGEWVVDVPAVVTPVEAVNIQPASKKSIEYLVGMGGTANPRDVRDVWINDGTMLQTADDSRDADRLEFSDGLNRHYWKVMYTDNRPWHTYCHAIVERMRGVAPDPHNTWVLSDGKWSDNGEWIDTGVWNDG